MHYRLTRAGVLIGLFLFFAVQSSAEIMTLKSGKVIEGKVVRESEHYLMFKDQSTGQVDAYLHEQIKSIVKEKSSSPEPSSIVETQSVPSLNTKIQPSQQKRTESTDNLLRIYGTEILDENAPTDQYDFSDDSTFYVKTEKDSLPNVLEKKIEENMESPSFVIASIAAAFLLYIFFFYPLYLIAKKTSSPHANLAWLPIINFYLMCKIAGRPGWWMILFFVPLVNIVIIAMIWMDITAARGKPAWLGLLILLPGISLFYQWYLAISKNGNESAGKGKKVAMIDEEKAKEEEEQALFDQIVPTKNAKPKKF